MLPGERSTQLLCEKRVTANARTCGVPEPASSKICEAERRNPRLYRIGRNQKFHAKATPKTIQKFYKVADEKRARLRELLKQGLDALEVVSSRQKLADERKTPLSELVKQALDALDRAGVSLVTSKPKLEEDLQNLLDGRTICGHVCFRRFDGGALMH